MDLLSGPVLHGGSYNANTVSTVPALVTLQLLRAGGDALYAAMEAKGERLMAGLRAMAAEVDVPLHVQGVGTAFNTTFGADEMIYEYRDYAVTDLATAETLADGAARPGCARNDAGNVVSLHGPQ